MSLISINWRQPNPLLINAALMLAGLANTFAFAPYQWHFLPFLTLLLLAFAVRSAITARQAAVFGFSYGLGWFGLGVSWVHVSIATFGGMPLWASLGIMALLVAYLALFPALATYLSRRLCSVRSAAWPLVLAVSWTLAENLRSWLFTGFPWLSLGYSQTESYLAAWAPLIGETGLSFLLVYSAAALLLWRQQRWQPMLALSLLLITPLLHNFKGWQLSGLQAPVALVQGNIKQVLRWDPAQELPTMKKYMDLTRPILQNRLVIWPEAAIPQREPDAQGYLYNLDLLAAEQQAAVVTGILDYKPNGDAYNGMVVLGRFGAGEGAGQYGYANQNRYQKHHLLPIGEFVPFEALLRDIAPFFDLPNSSFARGAWQQNNLTAKGFQLLPALCFEIVFARQIQANFSDQTDFVLTVSNDAWFGDSIGPWQHLQIAQMRALEFGRPLLRATNNGLTAMVLANGQISDQLPQFEDGVLLGEMPLTQGQTPYSQYGDWPLLSLCYLLALALLVRQIKQQPAATN